MTRLGLFAALMLATIPCSALADALFATRTIRAQEVISAEDLVLRRIHVDGAAEDMETIIGQEARVAIYAGRAIHSGDIGPAAIAERNQIVPLTYRNGPIEITTEGRALARGSAGETIRVMNLTSRRTVSATLAADGRAIVNQ